MTRQHFEMIARVLCYCQGHCDTEKESEVVSWVAEKFAEDLAHTNERFNCERFLTACGVRGAAMTPATRNNMLRYEHENPPRRIQTPDGEATLSPQPLVMLDSEGNEWSASSGDYFTAGMDEVLTDEHGEPMELVLPVHGYRDPFNNQH